MKRFRIKDLISTFLIVMISICVSLASSPPDQVCGPLGTDTFNWSDIAWTASSTNNSYDVNNTTYEINVTGSNFYFTPSVGPYYQGSQLSQDDQLVLSANNTGLTNGNTMTTTIDLGIAGIGVEDLAFSLFDVDGENGTAIYYETVIVTGYLNGVAVNPTLTGSSNHTILNNTVTASTTGVPIIGTNTNDAVVNVSFSSPVDQVVVEFYTNDDGTYNLGTNPGFSIYNLTHCALAAMPVEWLSINATSDGSNGVIDWATASEIDNDHFDIERSFDGENFEKIGEIKGSGTSSRVQTYTYTDKGIGNRVGTAFYRLNQVDYDGKNDYSDVLSVLFKNKNISVEVFPNPVVNSLNISVGDFSYYTIELYDMVGKKIYEDYNVSTISMDGYHSGAYVVRVIDGSGQMITTQRIVKR